MGIIGIKQEQAYGKFTTFGDVSNLDESEISIEEEEEKTVLDQLEEKEEEETKQFTQKELYDPKEIKPTKLEELFPDAPYTVYYQES